MTSIPTNQSVFNRSMTLIVEFLKQKGFSEGVIASITKETKSITADNPDGEYFPKVLDITQLERLLATCVIADCNNETVVAKANVNKQEKEQPSRRRGNNFTNVPLREVEEEWDGVDDMGYLFIPVSEEDLNAYAAREYEATTLGHEGYETYPQIIEWDDNLLESVKLRIEKLKKEFPGELKELLASLGIETPANKLSDDELNNLLLDHFKNQIMEENASPAPSKQKVQPISKVNEEYESFYLKVIQVKNKTGFEETKDFQIILQDIIADRYQVQDYLGSAAFSTAIQCYDLVAGRPVCMKIITNNKDFFDQSLDEIKLLTLIKSHGDLDKHNLLILYDYFYFKEHLFLVTELLRDNLYEFYKYNRESGDELYFTLDRLKKVTRQILVALDYIHQLGLIHCDLKPENILIKSYSRCEVKVIDLGSSCFITDHLSSYVQSRSYRAPEVILGLPYGRKVDIWSLGCIIAELYTGNVLFLNDSLATLLARVEAIIGPIPEHMKTSGVYSWRYYTLNNQLYDRRPDGPVLIETKKTSLKHRLGTDDTLFLDFITRMLSVDPAQRPTSAEALAHPWLANA